ncbi:hypothetical protein OE88DRAFT_1657073 [Heliocybe sulcata]|uniref:Protein kinase domain-containing protein n=1 Tax=Heliocybe sulcata TaxID=5364 RepID=A0A5C3N703_9AGAM|nr:hypothetical protein OE88DRAFT_1657073 [Heliocybe sulcata]
MRVGRSAKAFYLAVVKVFGGNIQQASSTWTDLRYPHVHVVCQAYMIQAGSFTIVTPLYLDGSIMQYGDAHPSEKFHLIQDAASGLAYLHSRGTSHGNIKGVA